MRLSSTKEERKKGKKKEKREENRGKKKRKSEGRKEMARSVSPSAFSLFRHHAVIATFKEKGKCVVRFVGFVCVFRLGR